MKTAHQLLTDYLQDGFVKSGITYEDLSLYTGVAEKTLREIIPGRKQIATRDLIKLFSMHLNLDYYLLKNLVINARLEATQKKLAEKL